jgi:hypothetical protein
MRTDTEEDFRVVLSLYAFMKSYKLVSELHLDQSVKWSYDCNA